jgi:hypothetical protein
MQQIIQGTEQVWLDFELIAADGTPVLSIDREDADLVLDIKLQNGTMTTPFTPAADAYRENGYGSYSVRRSGEFATLGTVTLLGTYDGVAIIGQAVQVVAAPLTANQIVQGLVTGSQPAGSLARTVRDIKQSGVLFEGQIVTATSDTAKLDAGASTVCVGQAIVIGVEGDIDRQARFVTDFDPATNIVTLDKPWCVIPPDGADYQIQVLRRSGDATEAKQDAAQAELNRMWRAADPIPRGQARWTIADGQAADVTLSEPS